MSFWRKLFGGAAPRSEPSPLDAFKHAAQEEERRRRRALEQEPRATQEELADRVANLRSIAGVQRAYNDLRHADFCDLVTAAVRQNNLSDDDATHALYLREWVSSGGAWRTSFPQWLTSEGQRHILQLNGEWVRSGDKHTTFNDWLVGAKSVQPPMDQPTSPTAERPATIPWARWDEIQPLAADGEWREEGGKLICCHEVTAVLPSQTVTSVKITCSVSRYDNGQLATYLRFTLTPYLYLMPDDEPFEPHLVKAPFALGLVADGAGRGTEDNPLIQGGIFQVNASATEDEPETAILVIVSSRDTTLAVRTLSVGSDLTLTLMDYEAEPPVRLRLRLRGDPSFARRYARLQSTV